VTAPLHRRRHLEPITAETGTVSASHAVPHSLQNVLVQALGVPYIDRRHFGRNCRLETIICSRPSGLDQIAGLNCQIDVNLQQRMAGAEMVISHFDRLWAWPGLGTGLAAIFHAVGAGDEPQTSHSSFRRLSPGPGGSESFLPSSTGARKAPPIIKSRTPQRNSRLLNSPMYGQCMGRQVANQVSAVGTHRSMITVVASDHRGRFDSCVGDFALVRKVRWRVGNLGRRAMDSTHLAGAVQNRFMPRVQMLSMLFDYSCLVSVPSLLR
jgi:hypothetical protein